MCQAAKLEARLSRVLRRFCLGLNKLWAPGAATECMSALIASNRSATRTSPRRTVLWQSSNNHRLAAAPILKSPSATLCRVDILSSSFTSIIDSNLSTHSHTQAHICGLQVQNNGKRVKRCFQYNGPCRCDEPSTAWPNLVDCPVREWREFVTQWRALPPTPPRPWAG